MSEATDTLTFIKDELSNLEMEDVIEILALAKEIRDTVTDNPLGAAAFVLVAAEMRVAMEGA